ncbi:MAG TPA: FG-GAP-like repeat-containing protein [Gemmataceae bacterium]|nr:FG-GAP-like repeat-containing protein [Gemmataceae bacterium]
MRLRKLRDVLHLRPARGEPLRAAGACRPRIEPLEDRTVPSFTPAGSYTLEYFSSNLGNHGLAADFNADGHLDLAVGGTGLSVLLGNGDGTFRGPESVYPGAGRTQAAGDFNLDGAVDLVTVTDSTAMLRLGNGDGTFQTPTQFLDWGPHYILTTAVGDVDGNGTSDLVFLGQVNGTGRYLVALANGNGTFRFAWGPRTHGYSPVSVSLADLNGDANQDLVIGDTFATGGAAYLGNGDGTFGTASAFLGGGHIHVADVNKDAIPDAVTTDWGPGLDDYGILLGNGDGTFDAVGSVPVDGFGLVIADYNADGNVDLTYRRYDGFGVALGRGDGTFTAPAVLHLGIYPVDLLAADVNEDGFPDLVGLTSDKVLSVFLNDGIWDGLPTTPPALVVGDAKVVEGHSGTRSAAFIVTLSAASTQPVTVGYSTADRTATSGDYGAASGTLTFAPGERTKTVTVAVYGDRAGEATESFALDLSGATNATIADGQGVGTILDDEPRIIVGDVTMTEGNKGQTTLFTFTVSLSAAYEQPVTVSFRTADGTASAHKSDYVARTGTLTLAPGETTKTVTLEVKGDTKPEAVEYFYLDLFGNSSNSVILDGRGLGTILNDD